MPMSQLWGESLSAPLGPIAMSQELSIVASFPRWSCSLAVLRSERAAQLDPSRPPNEPRLIELGSLAQLQLLAIS